MKKLLCIFYVFLLITLPSPAQNRKLITKDDASEQRVALIIGNSAYKDSPLLNPVNDARDMAQALRSSGFEVIFGENLSQNDMKRSIRAFGQKIRDGGVGLFYYAGHGVQIKGSNYLIPIDATITSEEEVEYESVDVGLVLAQMETAHNRLSIVILDACRNNPFARSFRSTQKGLAPIDAPSGTLIAYATAPGSVASDGTGRNGLYTQELLKAMRMPGLSVEEVFKSVRIAVRKATGDRQTPWELSSLVGQFYFTGDSANTTRLSEAETNPVTNPIQRPDKPIKTSTDDQAVRQDNKPDVERIETGKSKKGVIAQGQQKEYSFEGVANVALRFTFQKETILEHRENLTRYVAEIYNSRGQQLKRTIVYRGKGDVIVFTPQTDGWYILRLTGHYGYGNYTIYLDQI